MTASWYATEMLLDERKREIERNTRLAADRHLGRKVRRGRRYGKSR